MAWMHASTHAEAPEPDGQAKTHLMPAAHVGSAWHAAICEGHAFSRQSITGDGGAVAGGAKPEERSESIELLLIGDTEVHAGRREL